MMFAKLLHQGKEIWAGLLKARTIRTLTSASMLLMPIFLPPTVLAQSTGATNFTDSRVVYFPCGSINSGGAAFTGNTAEARVAARCFSQAYKVCQPATISANSSGIDAGTRRQFFIVPEPNNCLIVDVVENYVVPRFTNDAVYLCSNVQQVAEGLLIPGCGQDGDVLLRTNS